MENFGYQYPLYSFKLLPASTLLSGDAARYAIEVPEGLLVTAENLRARGARGRVDVYYDIVLDVLGFHARHLALFAGFGMDAEWARSYRYWGERMQELEGGRARLADRRYAGTRAGESPVKEGQALWRQLAFLVRSAGVDPSIVKGRPPGKGLDLHERLQQVAAALAVPERAEKLARRGFGPAEHRRLQEVIARIPAYRQDGHEHRRSVRSLTDVLTVIRGGLLGDTKMLSGYARVSLKPEEAREVQLGRLLRRKSTRRRTGASAPPLPVV